MLEENQTFMALSKRVLRLLANSNSNSSFRYLNTSSSSPSSSSSSSSLSSLPPNGFHFRQLSEAVKPNLRRAFLVDTLALVISFLFQFYLWVFLDFIDFEWLIYGFCHLGEGLRSTGRVVETSGGNHSCTNGSVERQFGECHSFLCLESWNAEGNC